MSRSDRELLYVNSIRAFASSLASEDDMHVYEVLNGATGSLSVLFPRSAAGNVALISTQKAAPSILSNANSAKSRLSARNNIFLLLIGSAILIFENVGLKNLALSAEV